MATRKQVRTEFYNHLELAADGLVPADNITEEEPEGEEDHPAVVHNDDYRKVPINDASSGPTEMRYDNNGDLTEVVYSTFHEASFGVAIIDHDESRKESIYEAIRSYFEKYEKRPWDESEIQADVHDVSVLDSTSEDDSDATPNVRGDRLIIRLGFERYHTLSRADGDFDNIQDVLTKTDGTYTTQ